VQDKYKLVGEGNFSERARWETKACCGDKTDFNEIGYDV
jgi:hypothetical protein